MLQLERPASLVDRVVRVICDEIEAGHFPPESRLPTEHQLAEQLSVSRSVVREAVSRLRADGVLVARRGLGSFISNRPKGEVFRLPRTLPTDLHLPQLFEMRLWAEVQAASIAALRHNDEDLEKMQSAMRAMDENRSDFAAAGAEDVTFHRIIANATRNEYFSTFHDFIGSQLQAARRASWQNSASYAGGSNSAQAEHLRLFQAIKAGDQVASARAAEAHLRAAAARLGIILPQIV